IDDKSPYHSLIRKRRMEGASLRYGLVSSTWFHKPGSDGILRFGKSEIGDPRFEYCPTRVLSPQDEGSANFTGVPSDRTWRSRYVSRRRAVTVGYFLIHIHDPGIARDLPLHPQYALQWTDCSEHEVCSPFDVVGSNRILTERSVPVCTVTKDRGVCLSIFGV